MAGVVARIHRCNLSFGTYSYLREQSLHCCQSVCIDVFERYFRVFRRGDTENKRVGKRKNSREEKKETGPNAVADASALRRAVADPHAQPDARADATDGRPDAVADRVEKFDRRGTEPIELFNIRIRAEILSEFRKFCQNSSEIQKLEDSLDL